MKLFSTVRDFLRTTALWIVMIPAGLGFLGMASNQAVLIANNDTFPVRVNIVKVYQDSVANPENTRVVKLPDGTVMLDDVHCLMTDKTHLNFLADTFDFHTSILSIGDLLLQFGDWLGSYSFVAWGIVVIGKLRKKE